jgi:4-hydroxy-tetrahydrodipicolinate synthase
MTMAKTTTTFTGAMTALVTPLRDGTLDRAALADLVEAQIAAGMDGLVAVGTTGESATLSVKEHVQVVEQVVALARKRVPVIAGAGANSTAEALALSLACKDVGADALLHVTPYYNKPTQDGLFRHFAAIAAAARMPVILYNVPGRTSCDLLPDTVARLAEVDHIVAIKEATGSVRRASEILERVGDRLDVLSGDDFVTMPIYAIGGRGVISVVANVAPAWMAEMWDAACASNWARARELHFKIQPLTTLLFEEPNPIPVKAALALMGRIGEEIRLPLDRASDGLRARLREVLAAEGLL